jgi:rhodanese-related sulfurtransferase
MSFLKALFGTSEHDVSFEQLQQALHTKTCHLIDVREPHEFHAGHPSGAVNMPLSRFDPKALPSDKPVVLICLAGGRSANALRIAHAAGLKEVRHYPGGFKGWCAKSGAVI